MKKLIFRQNGSHQQSHLLVVDRYSFSLFLQSIEKDFKWNRSNSKILAK